jgi:hypothetical protein
MQAVSSEGSEPGEREGVQKFAACERRGRGLKQGEKFLNGHTRMAEESAKSAHGQLFVLGNREMAAPSGFRPYEMASDLTDGLPSGLPESLCRFRAGEVGESRHAVKRRREFRAGQGESFASLLSGLRPRATRRWLP